MDLMLCAVAGLHDTKNHANVTYAQLSVLHTPWHAEKGESDKQRALRREVPKFVKVLGASFPQVSETLASAEHRSFQAARLAGAVEGQVLNGDTQMRLALEPVDVAKLLSDARDCVERSADLGRCIAQAEKRLPRVLVDEKYLTRVFGNLLRNAEKYAKGKDITLTARLSPDSDGKLVVISFADNGPGISPTLAEIIFQPPSPAKFLEAAKNHGTGFGLFFCRKVIEAHGGTIWVESPGSPGATFCFTLRAAL